MRRCVIVGGAPIQNYDRIRDLIKEDDYIICCDCGLRHMTGLGAAPSLIVGDFDSYENPESETETIVLPTAKDDTDTVYAVREGKKRGFTDFLLIGVIGGRLDHSLVNLYILYDLASEGMTGAASDDYSDIFFITPGNSAYVTDRYSYFSLVSITGNAGGVSIRNAKFPLENAEIRSEYQYAVSNEVLPGGTAEITVKSGGLLLICDL